MARNLLGEAGLALAPLAALGGLLLLLDRLPGRAVIGTALLLTGAATTFGAAMPRRLLFASEAYPDAGGAVGSAVYYAVDLVGGTIGTVLTLGLLYALGLSLLTGVGFAAALTALRDGAIHLADYARRFGESLRDGGKSRTDKPAAVRERPAEPPAEPEVRDLHEELAPEPPRRPRRKTRRRGSSRWCCRRAPGGCRSRRPVRSSRGSTRRRPSACWRSGTGSRSTTRKGPANA
ncbi:hypothetical protein [Rubrobacter tropicus]|uniref:hypothetical protein n=1 Tax=Rubrobacter tropicus TaxID=2653851 RepID=UPI001D185D51|nr:hypothetical protein [Rubrobacter tropicus]